MTIVPRLWPRRDLLRDVPVEARLFSVAQDTKLLAFCHWHKDKKARRTAVLVHGLEGCSESHYMRGIAAKSWRAGLNVVRLNQRNCGGTEALTPTLYNSGLSADYKAVVEELANVDGLSDIWLVGYSMGGNLVLKTAGEAGDELPALRGVLAVCPNIDPAACVNALEQPRNRMYHSYFLNRLKARMQRKAALFPGKFDLSNLQAIGTMREFEDRYTAPDGGYRDAADYYERAGARHVLAHIRISTVIMTAQDDPFIPYTTFQTSALRNNPRIRLIAPVHGGHCGFFQRFTPSEDRYWAENRLVEIMAKDLRQSEAAGRCSLR
jgi:predicted alpha/beta-fold hydrolase